MSSDVNPPRDPMSFDQPAGTSGKAIASLICGVLSFVCNIFTGIPAIVLGILGLSDIGRSEGRLGGRGLAIAGIVTGCVGSTFAVIGILVALLLPAIQAAREAARRNHSSNQLKQIELALMNYHEVHRTFPPAITADEAGRPMHSWRVQILPYLEEAALHGQYHFDEPWDSPSNKTLVARMPDVYRAAGESSQAIGTTNVVAIVGDETLWPGATATGLRDAQDGTSNTILLVQVADMGIPWTAPRDLTIDEFCKGINQPGGPKSVYARGIVCGFADGSVRVINEEVSPETLRALVTKAGGESIDSSALDY